MTSTLAIVGASVLRPVEFEAVATDIDDGLRRLASGAEALPILVEEPGRDVAYVCADGGAPRTWRGGFGAALVRCERQPRHSDRLAIDGMLRRHGLRVVDEPRRWMHDGAAFTAAVPVVPVQLQNVHRRTRAAHR